MKTICKIIIKILLVMVLIGFLWFRISVYYLGLIENNITGAALFLAMLLVTFEAFQRMREKPKETLFFSHKLFLLVSRLKTETWTAIGVVFYLVPIFYVLLGIDMVGLSPYSPLFSLFGLVGCMALYIYYFKLSIRKPNSSKLIFRISWLIGGLLSLWAIIYSVLYLAQVWLSPSWQVSEMAREDAPFFLFFAIWLIINIIFSARKMRRTASQSR